MTIEQRLDAIERKLKNVDDSYTLLTSTTYDDDLPLYTEARFKLPQRDWLELVKTEEYQRLLSILAQLEEWGGNSCQ
ncbi:MAG: hypothetical protein LBB86_01195 [Oscillospiraceae bacterium]|jgi:hypothetical protein|nr:hypothetical protein [Oscillospiraceae bacterium]